MALTLRRAYKMPTSTAPRAAESIHHRVDLRTTTG